MKGLMGDTSDNIPGKLQVLRENSNKIAEPI